MPIYEYKCKDCSEQFEKLVSINFENTPPCPVCNSENTIKLMSLTGGFGENNSSNCTGKTGFS